MPNDNPIGPSVTDWWYWDTSNPLPFVPYTPPQISIAWGEEDYGEDDTEPNSLLIPLIVWVAVFSAAIGIELGRRFH